MMASHPLPDEGTTLAHAAATRLEPGERVLRFATDFSLGALWLRDASRPSAEWERMGEARWSVIVPAGHEVTLWARPETTVNGLWPLAALPSDALVRLILLDCPIGDAELLAVEGLTSLRLLDLFRTGVTDGACSTVAGLPALEWLSLTGTAVGDTGVERLRGLDELERLSLKHTAVTDRSAPALAALPELRWLSLTGTHVTDDGLDALTRAPRLETLSVTGAHVTDAGLARFRAARPEVALIDH